MADADRRRLPRKRLYLPAGLVAPDGRILPADIVDLSRNGAQLGCLFLALGDCLARDVAVVDATGTRVPVVIGFDGGMPANATGAIDARIAWVRRIDQAHVRLGIAFEHVDDDIGARLVAALGVT